MAKIFGISLSLIFWKIKKTLAKDILLSAHLCASQWEFNLLKDLNKWDEEIDEIDKNFISQLKGLAHVNGVDEIIDEVHRP